MKCRKRNDPDFWRMARAFLHDYMPGVRNLSDKSVESYKQSLNSYLEFLREEKGIESADVSFACFSRDNAKQYVSWLKAEKNYSPKSVNLRLTAVKSFMKYCADEDIELRVFYAEIRSLKGQKEWKKPIQYLSPPATTAILSAYGTDTSKHRRNRMLLILMYDSGARVQELSDLNRSSLHLDARHPFITLVGKGRKTRNVPLMEKTILHLREYLKEFHAASAELPLFYSIMDGRPHRLSTDSIGLVLKTAADQARAACPEIPARVHCHLMRKTKAMDLYQNGIPLPIIMQLLGHENMSTTSGFYAFATLDMMYDAMKKAVPDSVAAQKLWKLPEVAQVLYSLN